MQLLLICVLLALNSGNATVEGKEMDEKIQNIIAQTVHQEHGWEPKEVRIDEVDRLKRGSCLFFTAGHKVRPLPYQLNYAVLNGERVVGESSKNAAATILDACGADATAGWWAEIVTRFHPELGSGIVLQEATTNRPAVRRVEEKKKEFKMPAFANEAGSKTITYYLLDPESNTLSLVKAAKNPDGSVTVERSELD